MAKEFDVEVAPDVETLLGAGLDGVAICAASSAHVELIGRAQDAGLTTFCVKPLASDLAGTLRITERLADALCRFTSASGVALTPASAPPAMR